MVALLLLFAVLGGLGFIILQLAVSADHFSGAPRKDFRIDDGRDHVPRRKNWSMARYRRRRARRSRGEPIAPDDGP